VATGLVIGGTILIIIEAPSQSSGVLLLAIGALSVFIYGPLILGSITSYWNVRKTGESRRYFVWWFGIVLGLEALGAVAIVIYALLTHAPTWLPIVFIGTGVALTAVALLVGQMLLRHEEARPLVERPWAPISRREIVRKIAIVTITFVVVLVLVLILFTVLGRGSTSAISKIGVQLSFAAEFAFFAAALACILVTLPLNRRLRESVSRDLGRLRKVGR
jgi:hypothetical protein